MYTLLRQDMNANRLYKTGLTQARRVLSFDNISTISCPLGGVQKSLPGIIVSSTTNACLQIYCTRSIASIDELRRDCATAAEVWLPYTVTGLDII
jgi:hypothetical protein